MAGNENPVKLCKHRLITIKIWTFSDGKVPFPCVSVLPWTCQQAMAESTVADLTMPGG